MGDASNARITLGADGRVLVGADLRAMLPAANRLRLGLRGVGCVGYATGKHEDDDGYQGCCESGSDSLNGIYLDTGPERSSST
jgi:hypothetical protein